MRHLPHYLFAACLAILAGTAAVILLERVGLAEPPPVHDDASAPMKQAPPPVFVQAPQLHATDAAPPLAAPPDPLKLIEDVQSKNWPAAVVVLLSLITWGLRRFSLPIGFLHTPKGMLVLSAVVGGLSAIAQAIAQHGFSMVALAVGVAGSIMSALAMANPSQMDQPSAVLSQRGNARVELLLLVATGAALAIAGSGCANLTPVDKGWIAVQAAASVGKSAEGALLEYDKAQQSKIVAAAVAECAKAPPLDFDGCKMKYGEEALNRYRADRQKVVAVVLDYEAAVAAGDALLPLVSSGAKPAAALDAFLLSLYDAGVAVRATLAAFGVTLGGAPAPAATPAPAPPVSENDRNMTSRLLFAFVGGV